MLRFFPVGGVSLDGGVPVTSSCPKAGIKNTLKKCRSLADSCSAHFSWPSFCRQFNERPNTFFSGFFCEHLVWTFCVTFSSFYGFQFLLNIYEKEPKNDQTCCTRKYAGPFSWSPNNVPNLDQCSRGKNQNKKKKCLSVFWPVNPKEPTTEEHTTMPNRPTKGPY